MSKHVWPTLYEGRPIPREALIQQGTLLVPTHLPAGILAYMEVEYRENLWPEVRDGYRRWVRRFAWDWHGRALHYQLIDLPVNLRLPQDAEEGESHALRLQPESVGSLPAEVPL